MGRPSRSIPISPVPLTPPKSASSWLPSMTSSSKRTFVFAVLSKYHQHPGTFSIGHTALISQNTAVYYTNWLTLTIIPTTIPLLVAFLRTGYHNTEWGRWFLWWPAIPASLLLCVYLLSITTLVFVAIAKDREFLFSFPIC